MSDKYAIKRISDPVHGTVGLRASEVELLSTLAFQRLRNIKQLGLAHFVFPGADYSRLSHCIGVCHVTGRILDSLNSYSDANIPEEEIQEYRLAGLLHDIGHFPFSHAFEEAVSDYYKDNQTTPALLDPQLDPQLPSTAEEPVDHETLGGLLLKNDREIQRILENRGISPEAIFSIFARKVPPKYANLVSSDLDADRIDYLLRTAQHTGLPYGSVDIEYILSQIRLDNENRICLTPQALRTVEHFLFGRYFDYLQVTYHKTVAAFEEVLKDIVTEMLKTGEIDCSTSGISKMVDSGAWHQFDDPYILQKIRHLESREGSMDDVLRTKINSLLRRVPPKLIGSIEFIDDRDKKHEHRRNIRDLERISHELSDEFGIPKDLWYVWDSKGRSLTSIGSFAPVSSLPADEDDLEQSIRIKLDDGSVPIVNFHRSVMSILAQKALYTARLYVLFPDGRESERDKITMRAREKLTHEHWINGKE